MKKYIVTYDLNKQGQNYDDLIEAIQNYTCIHVMQSVWFIKSSESAKEIADYLNQCIDNNDALFVSEITSNRQGWLNRKYWNFLK